MKERLPHTAMAQRRQSQMRHVVGRTPYDAGRQSLTAHRKACLPRRPTPVPRERDWGYEAHHCNNTIDCRGLACKKRSVHPRRSRGAPQHPAASRTRSAFPGSQSLCTHYRRCQGTGSNTQTPRRTNPTPSKAMRLEVRNITSTPNKIAKTNDS